MLCNTNNGQVRETPAFMQLQVQKEKGEKEDYVYWSPQTYGAWARAWEEAGRIGKEA